MQKIVLASTNSGKLVEIQAILAPIGIDLIQQSDLGISEVPETGLTFIENALIKARHASQFSGLPALADDSGLVVEALQGEPGLYSARYASAEGISNIEKLLNKMKEFPEAKRTAYFYCVIVFLKYPEDPAPLIYQGRWEGRILFAPQGGQGFGYDPIFYVPTHDCSAAELPKEIKNTISHRGIALQSFLRNFRH